MTFKQALRILPSVLYDGLDLVGQHKTVKDLRFKAVTELDLADEGDISLTDKDRAAILKFLSRTASAEVMIDPVNQSVNKLAFDIASDSANQNVYEGDEMANPLVSHPQSDLTPQDMQNLEAILDRVGNARLVDALSRIASEKAAHVQSNWQDATLARTWTRIGKRFDKLTASLELCDDVLGFHRESEGR